MGYNKDLDKYKESKEFQDILKKAQNKIETIEGQVNAVYNEGVAEWTETSVEDLKHKMTHNEFDVKDLWIKDLNWIIDQIKNPKAKELKTYYEFRVTNANMFLYQAINQLGSSNSILRYTELDMKRVERSHLFGMDNDIDSMIGQVEEKIDIDKGAF